MIYFIELHRSNSNAPVIFNIAHMMLVEEHGGKDRKVTMTNGFAIFVKEGLEEIKQAMAIASAGPVASISA